MTNSEVVQARRALLDALEALGVHRRSVVLVGAQAVYLRTGAADVALAEFTTDADLAIDPRSLTSAPLVERAMTAGGFTRDPANANPGAWISSQGIAVDLMVPDRLAGRGRRGVTAPPHDRGAMRRTVGLEAALVDHGLMPVAAMESADHRRFDVQVAGSAALLVAKLHKVAERLGDASRSQDKDAHDIYRLLRAAETADLVTNLRMLVQDDLGGSVTVSALTLLKELFADGPSAPGAFMAGRAEEGIGDPIQTALASSILAADIVAALAQ